MKTKTCFRFVPILILLLSFFNSMAGEQGHINYKASYVDSAIYYFNKSQTATGIDSTVFLKGLKMIDSMPTNDASIKRVENAAAQLKKARNSYLYNAVVSALFSKLVDALEHYRAIDFGKELINRYEANPNAEDRELFLVILAELRRPFRTSDKLEEGFDYYTTKLRYYLERNDSDAISICYFVHGGFYLTKGLPDLSIYYYKKSLIYLDKNKNEGAAYIGLRGWINNTAVVGQLNIVAGNYNEALIHLRTALESIIHAQKDSSNLDYVSFNIAYAKLMLNQLDSVPELLNNSIKISAKLNSYSGVAFAYQLYGLYFLKINQLDSAEFYFLECSKVMEEYSLPAYTPVGVLIPKYHLAQVRVKQNRLETAEELIKAELPVLVNLRGEVVKEYKLLVEVYLAEGDIKNANETFRKYSDLNEQLKADERKNRFMSFETEQKITDAEQTINNLENEKRVASLTRNYSIGIACLLLLIVLVAYNQNRLIKKSNAALSKALNKLSETQVQLVQSEKMAAFGVMASRVSHEIQNPLNFVNNFSDMSRDLVEDLMNSQNEEEKKQNSILLMANLQKINEHGKRAAIIVKQLQEHTRAGTAHEYFEG